MQREEEEAARKAEELKDELEVLQGAEEYEEIHDPRIEEIQRSLETAQLAASLAAAAASRASEEVFEREEAVIIAQKESFLMNATLPDHAEAIDPVDPAHAGFGRSLALEGSSELI